MPALFALLKSGSPLVPASSARVVDGKLILSFPDAVKPILWQMDLVPARASALEIEALQGGQAALMLKTPKGEQTVIAIFKNSEAALTALMTVSAALGDAHGQIRAGQPVLASAAGGIYGGAEPSPPRTMFAASSSASGPHGALRWAAGLAGIVLLAVLLNMLWTLSPRPPSSVPSSGNAPTPQLPLSGAPSTDAVGVPLSADDVLGRP